VRAAAGQIAPGSPRVIVKARYTRIVAGDLGAARAHLKYIVRDGVTREGAPGRLYDATRDDIDGGAFLDRSVTDPHQFRFDRQDGHHPPGRIPSRWRIGSRRSSRSRDVPSWV
jgi:type IV secretory pathway VirD2 relaxase